MGISICLYIVLLDPTDYFREGIDEGPAATEIHLYTRGHAAKGCCPVTTGPSSMAAGLRSSLGRQGTPVTVLALAFVQRHRHYEAV